MIFLKETAEFIPLKIYLIKGTSIGISLEQSEVPKKESTLIKVYQVKQTSDTSYTQIGRITANKHLWIGKNRLQILELVERFLNSHPNFIPLSHH